MKKSAVCIRLGMLLMFCCCYAFTWAFYSPWGLIFILLTINIGGYLVKKVDNCTILKLVNHLIFMLLLAAQNG